MPKWDSNIVHELKFKVLESQLSKTIFTGLIDYESQIQSSLLNNLNLNPVIIVYST